MKRAGPYLTLLIGVAVAAVLTVMSVLSVNASRKDDTANTAADAEPAATAPAEPGAAPTETPNPPAPPATTPPPTKPPAGNQATYAGRVIGGGGTIAIAVRDGRAIAYLCDGKRLEAWLSGTASGGTLALTGAKGARLDGTLANGVASGTVQAAGREFRFSVGVVKAPSGLYRASAKVRNATVVAGWIRLPDGSYVGAYTADGGEPAPAPALDPATRTATLDGTTLAATPIDGETGSGFTGG
jgi:serine/threonine-protein kinase